MVDSSNQPGDFMTPKEPTIPAWMEPIPESQDLNGPPPPPSQQKPKTKIILFSSLFCLILIGIIIVLAIKKPFSFLTSFFKPKAQPEIQLSEKSPANIAADKVYSWLISQTGQKGFYTLGSRCLLPQNSCEPLPEDSRVGLTTLWAYFKYYQVIPTPQVMDKINYLLDFYTNLQKSPVLQNSFWNCKLMYELYQSPVFTPEQKEKLKAICQKGTYYTEKKTEAAVAPSALSTQLLQKADPKNQVQSKIPENQAGDLNIFSSFASDLSAKYLWDKKEADLNQAKIYFSQAVDFLNQADPNKYVDGRCVLGISALDLFKATNDAGYLDFSQKLFQKEKIRETCLNEGDFQGNYFCSYSLSETAACALFAQDLYKQTQTDAYLQFKNKLLEQLMKHNFDYQNYAPQKNIGAFYELLSNGNNKALMYLTRENSLILGVLAGE